jgi:ferredoxin
MGMPDTMGLLISFADNPARQLPLGSPAVAERVVDLLDEAGITVGWLACRSARCGACRLAVDAGKALLCPPNAAESETLAHLGAGPDERLGCQLVVIAGARGKLVLAPRRP